MSFVVRHRVLAWGGVVVWALLVASLLVGVPDLDAAWGPYRAPLLVALLSVWEVMNLVCLVAGSSPARLGLSDASLARRFGLRTAMW